MVTLILVAIVPTSNTNVPSDTTNTPKDKP